MRSRRRRHDKAANDTKASANEVLNVMFKLAKARFGDAIKSFWFYDGDLIGLQPLAL
jgi:hypothetical protein